jgi:hypothetical protein
MLFICSHQATGQASWTYALKFELYDRDGNAISKQEYTEKGVSLYTMPVGAHSENSLKYDTLRKSFKFSQHTISGGSLLVFVASTDTTVFEIPTNYAHIPRLDLINGIYKLSCTRKNKNSFDYEITLQSRQPDLSNWNFFDDITKEYRPMNFKDLMEVKLE